jgi:hypothetical protein
LGFGIRDSEFANSLTAPLASNVKFTEQAQVLEVAKAFGMVFTLPLYSKNGWSPFVR